MAVLASLFLWLEREVAWKILEEPCFMTLLELLKNASLKIFIFENVRGLLNHDKGNTWKVIQERF